MVWSNVYVVKRESGVLQVNRRFKIGKYDVTCVDTENVITNIFP